MVFPPVHQCPFLLGSLEHDAIPHLTIAPPILIWDPSPIRKHFLGQVIKLSVVRDAVCNMLLLHGSEAAIAIQTGSGVSLQKRVCPGFHVSGRYAKPWHTFDIGSFKVDESGDRNGQLAWPPA